MLPLLPAAGLALGTLGLLALSTPLAGQQNDSTGSGPTAGVPSVEGFDPDRAILNEAPWFDPFRVTATEPLAGVLDEGRVAEETPLLVVQRGGHHLALLTTQMAYHHLAQGTLAGEPWMVTF